MRELTDRLYLSVFPGNTHCKQEAMAMDWRGTIAGELRDLIDIAENASPDFLLFRVESILERLILVAETSDVEINPLVFENLNEVAGRLYLQEQSDHISGGRTGRPSYDIPVEALETYLFAGVTVRDIAHLFGVSERTVHRRMAEHGIR